MRGKRQARVHSASMNELRETVAAGFAILRVGEPDAAGGMLRSFLLPTEIAIWRSRMAACWAHCITPSCRSASGRQCLLAKQNSSSRSRSAADPTPAKLQLEESGASSGRRCGAALQAMAPSATDEELAQPLPCRISADCEFPYMRWQLVRHIVVQSTPRLHRGQDRRDDPQALGQDAAQRRPHEST